MRPGRRLRGFHKGRFCSRIGVYKLEVTGGEFMNMMFDLFDLIFPVVFTDIWDDPIYLHKWNKNLE